jgi:hypothetical protein
MLLKKTMMCLFVAAVALVGGQSARATEFVFVLEANSAKGDKDRVPKRLILFPNLEGKWIASDQDGNDVPMDIKLTSDGLGHLYFTAERIVEVKNQDDPKIKYVYEVSGIIAEDLKTITLKYNVRRGPNATFATDAILRTIDATARYRLRTDE